MSFMTDNEKKMCEELKKMQPSLKSFDNRIKSVS